MNPRKLRIFILMALVGITMLLLNKWEAQPHSKVTSAPSLATHDLQASVVNETLGNESGYIQVSTDVLKVWIDPNGGDIVRAELLKYPVSIENSEPYALLDGSQQRFYITQIGLMSVQGPDYKTIGRGVYHASEQTFVLQPTQDELVVPLFYENNEGLKIKKELRFRRNSYLIDVNFSLNNKGSQPWKGQLYSKIIRGPGAESSKRLGMSTYLGGAYYLEDKPFNKLPFDKIAKRTLNDSVESGWVAMLEHYFLTAWIPNRGPFQYFSKEDSPNRFAIGTLSPESIVMPGDTEQLGGALYLGPEDADTLKQIAPGLQYTVDYGIFWPIAEPIFWGLKTIHEWVGNWGVAIICITILVKLLFFKLASSSYRSMAGMRNLQPSIAALKERYADDRQKLSQALIELYRKEKVNPLGGCLPILVQIPVFIALYYVLLETVELRQAPFIFWIKDLSEHDPFYVLPLLMGISMFVQQRLNPAPPDPVQARVFMLMPVIFTVLFLKFPAGLVLYWVVNNTLSITQQAVIMKRYRTNNPKTITSLATKAANE